MLSQESQSTTKTATLNPDIRDAQLKLLPFSSMVESTCKDCGMHTEHSVTQLVKEGRLGARSVNDLEESMVCRRVGCGGPVTLELKTGD